MSLESVLHSCWSICSSRPVNLIPNISMHRPHCTAMLLVPHRWRILRRAAVSIDHSPPRALSIAVWESIDSRYRCAYRRTSPSRSVLMSWTSMTMEISRIFSSAVRKDDHRPLCRRWNSSHVFIPRPSRGYWHPLRLIKVNFVSSVAWVSS